MKPDSLIIAAALAGIAFCLYLASPFLPGILGALVLAVMFAPAVKRLIGLTGRPNLAAAIGVVLAILLVLIPASLVATAATGEFRSFFSQLGAKSTAEGGWSELISSYADPALYWVASRTGVPAEELRSALLGRLTQAGGTLLRSTTALASGLTDAILQLVVAMMTLFFLLRDGDQILAQIRGNSPLPARQTEILIDSAASSLVANVYGVLGVAATQGFLAGIGYWLVDLPSPVLWAVVTALFSMVPLVGSAVVWVPAAIILAAGGSWGRALVLVAWGGGVVGMSDNFLRPWIIGQRTNSNRLLVFFALLGGAKLFGIAGLFIGPVVLSVTGVLLQFWNSDREAKVQV